MPSASANHGASPSAALSLKAMQQGPSIADIAGDPAWLAHRYDPGQDAVHLLRLEREGHGKVIFVTDEYLPGDAPRLVVERKALVAAAPPEAPLHFIFHSAYCCSTMLARAFDRPGLAMSLKEPVILNDLVGWRRRGGEPARVGTVLSDALRLLGRGWGPGEAVVVKPSNILNGLAAAMLTIRPGAGAVLLHAPLEAYLGSIARKGLWGRLWARELFIGLAKDQLIDFGFSSEEYLGQSDLQIAAIGWLAQARLFAELAQRFPDRVRTLDSETLVARPAEAMAALGRLFGLAIDEATAAKIAAGPAFTTHSKSAAGFGAEERARERLEGASAHADEIDKVAQWAAAVAASAGIALTPPAALL